MHGGSESQSQHSIPTIMWLFNTLWRHFWISVVSFSQTSERPMRKGSGKSNPLPWESLKVELMPDQEDQVHSVNWVESLIWVFLGLHHLPKKYFALNGVHEAEKVEPIVCLSGWWTDPRLPLDPQHLKVSLGKDTNWSSNDSWWLFHWCGSECVCVPDEQVGSLCWSTCQ